MQKERNSNRPFETVEPLAAKSSDTPNLGMDPVMDERTIQGGVFDNTFLEGDHKAGSSASCARLFVQNHPSCLFSACLCTSSITTQRMLVQGLKQDLVDRANGEYKGKTIMICWEHKNMCVALSFSCVTPFIS